MGGRDRGSSRQSPGPRGSASENRHHAGPIWVPLLDDVPCLAEPSVVDSRGAGRGRASQPDHRARGAEAWGEARARPNASDKELIKPDKILLLKETAEWRMKSPRSPTTTRPWNRTSTNRRCGFT